MTQEFTIEPAIRERGEVPEGVPIVRQFITSDDKNHINAAAHRLFGILTWKRPYDSATEELFARHYLDPIKGMEKDAFANRHLHIPYPDGSPCRIMWSCHIDTCHHDEGYQRLEVKKDVSKSNLPYVQTIKGEGSCLGADDGTGVWLLLELIAMQKPGYYIFHRGEERGCVGSRWLKDNWADKLKLHFDAAVALDRKDFDNFITHQSSERCCSDGFARHFSKQLGMNFKPDPSGMVTDTRQYTDLIPECTNLSVGYQSQHGPLERQYVNFALELRKNLLGVDLKSLPILRDPKKREYRSFGGYGQNYRHTYKDPTVDPTAFGNEPWAPSHPKEFWVRSLGEHKDILKADAMFVVGKGWVTKPQDLRRVPRLTVIPANDPPEVIEGEVVDEDDLSKEELTWLQMVRDNDKTLLQLVKDYPMAAVRLILALKGNKLDLLTKVYGEAEWLDFMVELDEEDAAEDARAGIVDTTPPEDLPTIDATGHCTNCKALEAYCYCNNSETFCQKCFKTHFNCTCDGKAGPATAEGVCLVCKRLDEFCQCDL